MEVQGESPLAGVRGYFKLDNVTCLFFPSFLFCFLFSLLRCPHPPYMIWHCIWSQVSPKNCFKLHSLIFVNELCKWYIYIGLSMKGVQKCWMLDFFLPFCNQNLTLDLFLFCFIYTLWILWYPQWYFAELVVQGYKTVTFDLLSEKYELLYYNA